MSSSGTTGDASDVVAGIVVVAANEQRDQPVDLDRWSELAREALWASGAGAGELNLLFVDRAEMTLLNAEHMGEDRCTDVLSFPIDAGDDPSDPFADGNLLGERLLGDIVICPDYAAEQAPGHAGTYEDELALLVVHGVLHIVGMDHAEPVGAAAMQSAEEELLGRFHS